MPSKLSPVTEITPQLIATATLRLDTPGAGFTDITHHAASFVAQAGAGEGTLLIFLRHTSASLTIQENADPDVCRDLKEFFARLVPPSSNPAMSWVRHTDEGADDMPAHIKAALTQVSIGIPVIARRLAFGTWQGLYLFEHRDRPHRRSVVLHLSA